MDMTNALPYNMNLAQAPITPPPPPPLVRLHTTMARLTYPTVQIPPLPTVGLMCVLTLE